MMNLFYEPLPECVPVGGSYYAILTDFRDWLMFGDMLKDDELRPEDKLDLMREWFTETPACITKEMYEALRDFCEAKALNRDEPDEQDAGEPEHLTRPPTFDWCIDAGVVIADFRRFYQIDLLRVEYLHWWEFLSLLWSLPDESQTFRRIGIRSTDLSKIRDADRKRAIAKAQLRIAIPFEMDDFAIGEAFSI